MKFLIAKKDGTKCNGCPGFIERGDEMILNFVNKPGFKKVLCYHVLCYIPWYTQMFSNKWNDWKKGAGNNPKPPKMGRPIIHQNASRDILLNRLRANLCYHKKHNHDNKVKIIEGKIGKVLGK